MAVKRWVFCNGYNEVVFVFIVTGQAGMKFGNKTSVGVLY